MIPRVARDEVCVRSDPAAPASTWIARPRARRGSPDRPLRVFFDATSALMLAAVAACGGCYAHHERARGPVDGGLDTAAPRECGGDAAADSLLAALRAARCERDVRCPAVAAWATVDDCIEREDLAPLVTDPALGGVDWRAIELVRRGVLGVEAELVEACLESIRSHCLRTGDAALLDVSADDDPCRRMVRACAPSSECWIDGQCPRGEYCTAEVGSLCAPGRCAPMRARGARCDDARECRGEGDGAACLGERCMDLSIRRSSVGGPCGVMARSDDATLLECADGLLCDRETGRCVAAPTHGEPCVRRGARGLCSAGLLCADDRGCRTPDETLIDAEGASCTIPCDYRVDLACTSRGCVETRGGPRDACSAYYGGCGPGLRCALTEGSPDLQCVPPAARGQRCDAHDHCASGCCTSAGTCA